MLMAEIMATSLCKYDRYICFYRSTMLTLKVQSANIVSPERNALYKGKGRGQFSRSQHIDKFA